VLKMSHVHEAERRCGMLLSSGEQTSLPCC
jgi:hypothetical protein